MYQLIYIFLTTVKCIVTALMLFLMARGLLSLFPIDEDSPIITFLLVVTEPVILPVRIVLDRFGWGEGSPIDIAFIVTFLMLAILDMFL